MQQFSLVYNNLFVFLEPVDQPRPTYQGSSSDLKWVQYTRIPFISFDSIGKSFVQISIFMWGRATVLQVKYSRGNHVQGRTVSEGIPTGR